MKEKSQKNLRKPNNKKNLYKGSKLISKAPKRPKKIHRNPKLVKNMP